MSLAIVPAAGKAERFGSAKLVSDVGGQPMVARTVRSLLDGGVSRVVVVVAPGSPVIGLHETRKAFPAPAVVLAINPDPDRGMFSSIQAGLAAAEAEIVLVLPADMPFVRPATVAAVLAAAARGDAVVLPTWQGRHGHPIAIPGALRDAILSAPSGSSLKPVLAATGIEHRELEVIDRGILRDVDAPADLRPVD